MDGAGPIMNGMNGINGLNGHKDSNGCKYGSVYMLSGIFAVLIYQFLTLKMHLTLLVVERKLLNVYVDTSFCTCRHVRYIYIK